MYVCFCINQKEYGGGEEMGTMFLQMFGEGEKENKRLPHRLEEKESTQQQQMASQEGRERREEGHSQWRENRRQRRKGTCKGQGMENPTKCHPWQKKA